MATCVVVLSGVLAVPLLGLPANAAGAFGEEGLIVAAVSVPRGEGFDPDIFTIERDGSRARNLTDQSGPQTEPSWSPDGRAIAYSSRYGLHVMRRSVADATWIARTKRGSGSTTSPHWPAWSPDGTRIVYVDQVREDTVGYTSADLVLITPTGKRVRVLATYDGSIFAPSWSPDGKRLAFARCTTTNLVVTSDSSCEIRVLDLNEGTETAFSRGTGDSDMWPSWQTDGKLLFLRFTACTTAGCSPAVYRSEPDGEGQELIEAAEDWTGDGEEDFIYRVLASPQSSSRVLVSLDTGIPFESELWLWDLASDRRSFLYRGSLGQRIDWQPDCTVSGTPGNDVLRGTPGRDLICASSGDDRIHGLGGDDVIFGHAGSDRIDGGPGADILVGSGGRDSCDRDPRDHSRVC